MSFEIGQTVQYIGFMRPDLKNRCGVIGDINNSNLDNFKSILKLNSYENKDDSINRLK